MGPRSWAPKSSSYYCKLRHVTPRLGRARPAGRINTQRACAGGVRVYVYVCTCVRVRVCVCVRVYVCVRACVRACVWAPVKYIHVVSPVTRLWLNLTPAVNISCGVVQIIDSSSLVFGLANQSLVLSFIAQENGNKQ